MSHLTPEERAALIKRMVGEVNQILTDNTKKLEDEVKALRIQFMKDFKYYLIRTKSVGLITYHIN